MLSALCEQVLNGSLQLKRALNFLLFSNVFVAFPVTCLAHQTHLLLNLGPDIRFLALIYSSTLFTYCFHRVYPVRFKYEGETSNRFQWYRQNKTAFNLIMAVAFLAALGILIIDFSYQLIWFTPVVIIALSYTLALFPYKGKMIRLRDIPYLKVFLIVGVVTYTTTYLPLLYGEIEINMYAPNFILLVISRALFLFAITLPFDIRDLEFDVQTNLKTFPVAIGVGNTKLISVAMIIGFLVSEYLRYIMFDGSLSVFFAMIVSGVTTLALIAFARPNGSEYFYSLGLEGTMIVQLILVTVAVQV